MEACSCTVNTTCFHWVTNVASCALVLVVSCNIDGALAHAVVPHSCGRTQFIFDAVADRIGTWATNKQSVAHEEVGAHSLNSGPSRSGTGALQDSTSCAIRPESTIVGRG